MDKLVPWFNLKSVPGIGNLLFRRLLDRFSSPRQVFNASRDELLAVEGITPRLAAAVVSQRKTPHPVEAELEVIATSGCRILTCQDNEYPAQIGRAHV